MLDQRFHNPNEEFIIDVRPLHEVVLINQKVKKRGTICRNVVPFFDVAAFNDLKNMVLLYNPLNLTYENYSKQLALVDQKTSELFNSQSLQVT